VILSCSREPRNPLRAAGIAAIWAVSNDLDDVKNWDDDDDEAVSVTLQGSSTQIVLTNHETGTSDNHTGLSTATKYYCTIERASDTSIELRIYSDSDRSTLVDTLSVSVAAGRAWRYLLACNSYNDSQADAITFDVENLASVEDGLEYFYNNDWQVVEIRKDGSEDPYKQYVWDIRYIDAPVLRWHDENEDGDFLDTDETLYYTNDANMNVTALVATDGDVVERYMYDPYGQVLVLNGADDADDQVSEWSEDADNTSDWDNELLFAGYRFDSETGLCHVRHRSYHPRLGRWMQRDPIGYADGMGAYEYVGSHPARGLDPSGQREALVSLQVERTVAGGSIEVYTDAGDEVGVAIAPGEKSHGGFFGSFGRAWNRWRQDVDAKLDLYEDALATEFCAALNVSLSADRPRRWQICPEYRWRITVKNRCCASNAVQLSTASLAGPYATATVPGSRIIPLGVGESEPLAPDVVLSLALPAVMPDRPGGTKQFEAQRFESYSAVYVAASCAE